MSAIKKAAAGKFDPTRVLILGFIAAIAVGTVLLWLPISSKSREFTPLFNSFFTATSATCVTGLSMYDTFSHWSLFGQIVLAVLVQVGGLGFVTIITFFNVAAGKKLGYRTLAGAAGDLSENSFKDGRNIFVSIIKYSAIFELVGAVILSAVFIPKYGIYGLWMGIFMSVTAFCNAGFDLLGIEKADSSLMTVSDNPVVLITIALLITLGGLGYIVWENFINIRSRKKFSLHTKAVLLMSAVLTVGGTVFFLISEYSNPQTMGDMSFGEKLLNAFFSSVTVRTAGFDSLNFSEMNEFSQLGAILLMFIGAAPGSTGGGIKVTTLFVIIVTVTSYMKNKNDVELMGHKLDKLTVYRTLVMTVLSLVAVIVCFTALYFSMPSSTQTLNDGAVQCLFDAVSAFSTTGVSSGAAAAAGVVGKWLLLVTMFIGRIGPVSLVMSLVLNSSKRKNIVLPDGQILIG